MCGARSLGEGEALGVRVAAFPRDDGARPSPRVGPSHVAELVEMIGAHWLLHASDYPHDHGPSVESLYDTLGEDERRAVLHGNAAELYGLAT